MNKEQIFGALKDCFPLYETEIINTVLTYYHKKDPNDPNLMYRVSNELLAQQTKKEKQNQNNQEYNLLQKKDMYQKHNQKRNSIYNSETNYFSSKLKKDNPYESVQNQKQKKKKIIKDPQKSNLSPYSFNRNENMDKNRFDQNNNMKRNKMSNYLGFQTNSHWEELVDLKKQRRDERTLKRKQEQLDLLLIYFLNMFPTIEENVMSGLLTSYLDRLVKKDDNALEEITEILKDAVQPNQRQKQEIVQENLIYNKENLFGKVIDILPDIEHEYLSDLIDLKIKFENQFEKSNTGEVYDPFFHIMDLITEKKSYPKEKRKKPKKKKNPKEIDWMKNEERVNKKYIEQCFRYLKNEFLFLNAGQIKNVMKKNKNRYVPSYKELENKKPSMWNKKQKRNRVKIGLDNFCDRMQQEIKFIKEEKRKVDERKDFEFAEKLNDQEYEDMGAKLNCMCCYVPVTFEKMVSCKGGHLFCVDCLHNLVKHAIGQRKKEIKCPGVEKCEFGFSKEMIQKAVPEKTWDLFERLVQESEIKSAGIENLKKCPNCDYAVIIESKSTCILECMNPECMRETCLLCGEEAHRGISCQEVKKDKNSDLRTYIEEQMTNALLRKCNKCGQSYYKTEGCNRIVCTNCKENMCYICQKSIKWEKYNHFSNQPGRCKLWTTKEEDEKRIKVAESIAKQKVLKLQKEREKKDTMKKKKFIENYTIFGRK
ncbi:e3 ubiquitin-protein ligase [Anaeramoeba flamelloides]|uniref:E3 ubiquitin-protein ligase n=1 Tax=Anaeramoeba flamelloides TaxID=1746091 RepID=A0AAV7YR64_9EUKA|nr:e3 ubiquitin-protein ligase [Anaeramoeba flamelloides]